MNAKCAICGGTFTPDPHKLKLGRGKYCSKPCQYAARRTHGEASKLTIEYATWRRMKIRCYDQNSEDYPDYGGRGIVVCDRWRDDFACFLADMGRRPSAQHSLDRKDTNGNYEHGNCRWATPKEQANNRRRPPIRIEFQGERLTIGEWADRLGMARDTLKARLYRMSPERALTQPVDETKWKNRQRADSAAA